MMMPTASDWPVFVLDLVQSLPGELALKGTLVLVMAGLAALAMKKSSAAARYGVWTAAMIGLLALPGLLLLVPNWGVVPDLEIRPRQVTTVDTSDYRERLPLNELAAGLDAAPI